MSNAGMGLVVWVLFIMTLGCAGRVPAHGSVAGLAMRGKVDSRVARDYLAGEELPSDLELVRSHHLDEHTVPSREQLAAVAARYSPDVATLLFVEALASQPENRSLRARYDAELAHVRANGIDATRPSGTEDVTVLFVPGWFYASHGDETNADLRHQRKILTRIGVAHELVRIAENGTVEANARVVADAVRAHSTDGRRIILVSASKSGPEVALALGHELSAAESRAVVAWLSIGGVLRGSPFADRMMQPDLCWIANLKLRHEGFDIEGLRSLRTEPRRAAFASLQLPAHVVRVAYIAAPLSGQISRRADFGYARMRKHGPNDGLTLLVDELVPGGLALVEPGVDHFFDFAPGAEDLSTAALLRVLVNDAS